MESSNYKKEDMPGSQKLESAAKSLLSLTLQFLLFQACLSFRADKRLIHRNAYQPAAVMASRQTQSFNQLNLPLPHCCSNAIND
jgi:serine acetyltransferase